MPFSVNDAPAERDYRTDNHGIVNTLPRKVAGQAGAGKSAFQRSH
jgi:hypothetical protein